MEEGTDKIKTAIITFVIVGLLLGTGLLILFNMKDEFWSTSSTSDAITLVNGSEVHLTHTNLYSFTSCVNTSNPSQIVPSSNYTVNTTSGTVKLNC